MSIRERQEARRLRIEARHKEDASLERLAAIEEAERQSAAATARGPETSAEGRFMEFSNRDAAERERVQRKELMVDGVPFSQIRPSQEEMDVDAARGIARAEEQFIPKLESAEQAFALAQVLNKNRNGFQGGMTESRYKFGLKAINRFNEENPGELARMYQQGETATWERENITTEAWGENQYERQRKGRESRYGGGKDPFPMYGGVPVQNLPADSYERILYEEGQRGLDTTTGLSRNILDTMEAAVQFDNPRVRRVFVEAAARDAIEDAGLSVPDDYPVVQVNDNLEKLMFLRPTEDGKLRWTLADSEVFRPRDVAGFLADPSDLLSAIGAGVGVAVGKNKASSEFFGDIIGRNVGLAIEFLVASGDVTLEEYHSAVMGTPLESGFETMASRFMGRALAAPETKVLHGPNEDAGVLRANVQESADAMQVMQDLTGRKMSVQPAAAAGSKKGLVETKSKEKNLPAKTKQGLEAERLNSVEIVAEANTKLAEPKAGSPEFDTFEVVQRANDNIAAVQANASPHVVRETEKLGPNRYVVDYQWKVDDVAGTKIKGGEFDGYDVGIAVIVDEDAGTAILDEAFGGTGGPNTIALLERAWQEVSDDGFALGSGDSVSASAQKMIRRMEDRGWTFRLNPAAEKAPNGNLFTTDKTPVYFIEGAPGDVVATGRWATDEFDRMAVESGVENVEQLLPAAQEFANARHANLMTTIGWSQQRRVSNYTIANPRTTGLRTQIRQIQNRIQQSLTGAETSEANKILGATVRRETDEEGIPFLTGLANDELDVGNLLTARDKLATIAADTGDPDVIAVVGTIDNLLKNGKVTTAKGNPIAESSRAKLNQAIAGVRTAEEGVAHATDLTNSSMIFKRNANGEFVYTNAKDWDTLLAGNAKFFTNLKPVLDANPALKDASAQALREQYRTRVLDKEGGWTRANHDKFMARYGNSMEVVFDEKDFADLARFEVAGNRSPWDALIKKTEERAYRAWRASGGDTTEGVPDGFKISPQRILESFRNRPFGEATMYIEWARKNDPDTFASLQQVTKIQIRDELHKKYLNPDKGVGGFGRASAMQAWFKENQKLMSTMFGQEYTNQVRAIMYANRLNRLPFSVKGAADETQNLVTRAFRSLIGPLTKPQRQLTAAQFARTRLAARKAMELLSDPEAVRQLTVAAQKGVTMNSQAGIALLSRLGVFSDAGIVGDPADPEYQRAAMAYFADLASMEEGE